MVSCGSIMKVVLGVPKLKVYSPEQIETNIKALPAAANIVDIQMMGVPEEDEIKTLIYEAIMQKTYVFNSDKKLLCYDGDESCTQNALNNLESKGLSAVFKFCEQPQDSLRGFADFSLFEKRFNIPESLAFENYEHIVVTFWNTDIEKNEIAENWQTFHHYFSKEEHVIFLRVWTDLNESWGLNPDRKARFINRKVTGEKRAYILTLDDLPYK